jgi:4-coumarate--CoA ligase
MAQSTADPAPDLPECPPLDADAAWRVLAHLLAGEPSAFHGGAPAADTLDADRRLEEADLGADSLGRLTLAQRVADVFDLRRLGREDLLLARRRLGDWHALAGESWARGPRHFAFQSSGSQGKPKRIVHPAARLWAEARVLADHLPGRRRVVALVPAHHIYGFIFTVLLPRALGVPVLDLAGAGPSAVAGRLAPGDLVVAVPAIWRYLASALWPVPGDLVGTSSAAPLDRETAQRLVADTGFARVLEIYGASETAGVGLRDDPDAPFRLLETWNSVGDGEGGRTLVRVDNGAQVAAPDRLDWLDARTFRPAGRLDGAVMIGGTTVHPGAVTRKLAGRPGVADARVRPSGQRLKALLVPAEGYDPEALKAEVRAWAQHALPAAERPVSLTCAERIPVDALGKERDWSEDDA